MLETKITYNLTAEDSCSRVLSGTFDNYRREREY